MTKSPGAPRLVSASVEIHSLEPMERLSIKVGTESEEVVPAKPEWCEANWGAGPIDAWKAHHLGQTVAASAERARDVLKVLIALETAAASEETVGVAPSTWQR